MTGHPIGTRIVAFDEERGVVITVAYESHGLRQMVALDSGDAVDYLVKDLYRESDVDEAIFGEIGAYQRESIAPRSPR